MRICRVATIPYQLSYISASVDRFLEEGDHVVLVSSAATDDLSFKHRNLLHNIPLRRKISPINDLVSLVKLTVLLRRGKFDVVHSISPKAGLIAAIAGALARTPVRVHTWTGQVWATSAEGPGQRLMKAIDRVILKLNSACYCDSSSQRDFLISHDIGTVDTIGVISNGSLAGVDLDRFRSSSQVRQEAKKIRAGLGLAPSDVLITFVGRVTPEKGLNELIEAFESVSAAAPHTHLLIVGPKDGELGRGASLNSDLENLPARVSYAGAAANPEFYYEASDILCLPSYREGFGTVVIEAAAMGVPCVGARIPGLVDAVVDGETGILVPVRDVHKLSEALVELSIDSSKREALGAAAQKRTTQLFDAKLIADNVRASYEQLLAKPAPVSQLKNSTGLLLLSLNSRPPNYLAGLVTSLGSDIQYRVISPVEIPRADAGSQIRIASGAGLFEVLNPMRVSALALRVWSETRRTTDRPIVHLVATHPWSPIVLAIARILGAETVVTRHDAQPHLGEESRVISMLQKLEATLATTVIVPSMAVAKELEGDAVSSKVRVVPLPLGNRPKTARQRQAEDRFHWLFLGRIYQYKGVDLLIEAFRRLKPDWPLLTLSIAGDDPTGLTQSFEPENGLSIDVGWLTDQELSNRLTRGGVVVLPYREASQSAVAMEGLAHGVPVVATPVGGLPEQINHEETGLLTANTSVDALCETLERLLNDPDLYMRLVDGAAESEDSGGKSYRRFLLDRLGR